ncbi:MAG: alkyl sulfatase dimerization domain-containing protein [Roseobacter sp.]|uniref:alkyl sulfatase dimerization domain-containing protein n=1 Tax=Tateyamaria sp. TaxID=1929288 RepID=UPI00327318A3
MTIDDLIHSVKLPPELAETPDVRNNYGRVYFEAPANFLWTLGCFKGISTSLDPMEPRHKAAPFIDLVGGVDAALVAITRGRANGDFKRVLQLMDRLLNAEEDVAGNSLLKTEILKDCAVVHFISQRGTTTFCAQKTGTGGLGHPNKRDCQTTLA